ncbi:Trihydrophobin [Escovopsis weberi]|uniref:Trihydrophobin n=1 Tax=Escovopsis weberi TaxID=150374 RepID=A0A0M8N7E4_ESCWE|nr:Trihydrophobin [Escovopsis weberi]
MQFFTIAALAAVAIASPLESRQTGPQALCPAGFQSNPQCCDVDIGGVLDINCNSPSPLPANPVQFQQFCSAIGKKATCCFLPAIGQAAFCVPAIGTPN